MKSIFISIFARWIRSRVVRDSKNALEDQALIFKQLIHKAKSTKFGLDHHFNKINSYSDFAKNVPIRDYESLKDYIEEIRAGKESILWPGKPKYFAKTSGTTSGVKYIPITRESMPNHINSARNALLNYVSLSGNARIFNGKMIFLSGSPKLKYENGIGIGRLSGIVNHEIPFWAKKNKLPNDEINCIEDWQDKLDQITAETSQQDMRLISGIPPWVQMYYETLLDKTDIDSISALFPNYSLFVYGGVNYAPYAASLEKIVAKKIDTLETYPASEGFIAFQDQLNDSSLLLNTNSGIFYEFVPLNEIDQEEPKRLQLVNVELDTDYALLITNNAGLWSYSIGDTIRFVSLNPYRIIVSGRIKHHISAFGEHVISKEVEESISRALTLHDAEITEFTVAPQVNPSENELPYHEWLIEFAREPKDISSFASDVEHFMEAQNIYYKDLIDGAVLRSLVIRSLPKMSFQKYMESIGKLGGQNKVPRLSNNRKIADKLIEISKT